MSDQTNQPERRCETCACWRRLRNMRAGRCHRHPPTAIPAEQAGNKWEKSVHPRTRANDWCYEWKDKTKADG